MFRNVQADEGKKSTGTLRRDTLRMKEVPFNKLQRLKDEAKYLSDNKPKFLRTLKSSTDESLL